MLLDVLWGLKWGLVFAFGFSVLALLMVVLTGGEIIERQGVSLPATLIIYVSGGLGGGLVLGILRPLTRWRIGSTLVGIVVMLFASCLASLILIGPIPAWSAGQWLGIVVCGIMYGGLGGYYYWERPARP